MPDLNLVLWALGLLLPGTLLLLLVSRGLASDLPWFAGLLAFYILRSAALYFLFGHVASAVYGGLYLGLSLADIVLQLAVMLELAPAILPRLSALGRAGLLSALVLAAAALAFAVTLPLPSHSPAPPDRAILFTGFLVLLLLLASRLSAANRIQERILGGLAVTDGAAAVAQLGRTIAAAHRSRQAFTAWSLSAAAVYLAVILFWIFALVPRRADGASPGALAARS